MWRKVLTFFTILFIVFLAYFSYKLLKEKEVAVNSLFDAIPYDASIIFEINRPELLLDFVHTPSIDAESFFNIPFIRDPLEKLKLIDSIALQEREVAAALRRPHSALITGHQVGKDKVEFVYYLKLNSEKEFDPIDKIIKENIKAKGNVSQHNYEDATINDVTVFNRKSGGFSYAYYRGMVILSKSSILLEEVVRQTKSNVSIVNKTGLETVMNAAGKGSPLNIYINFEFFPTIALNFIHPRFKPQLESISKFARWVELDCNIDNNAIILTGFSSADNTIGFLSDIFKDQEPLNLTLPGLLPSGTQSFFALGISDYLKFRQNFADYQLKNLDEPDFDENLTDFKESTGTDLPVEFAKIFDEELCFSYYPSGTNSLTNNIFTVIRTKGSREARHFLSQIDSITDKKIIDSTEFYSFRLNIPRLLFGDVFGLNKNQFCKQTDNYLIFADSVVFLKRFCDEFSRLKNLSLSHSYRNTTNLLSEDMYCYFYLSPNAELLYRNYLRYTSDQMFTQYKYGLSQVQAIVYQFGRNNNLLYNNAFIQFSAKSQDDISKKWEIGLENSLRSDITLVKNHTTGSNEIICQDKSNNLYLISTNGEILWKRKLSGPIQGEIFQADLFRNKKLQYLMNTSDQIIVIDRNGKDVEGFPVKLKYKASAGMAVFDYDKNRNYRLLIPAVNKMLFCFDKEGKEVPGWSKPSIGTNVGEIRYFSNNGKDYIVVDDETGIHFFDRRGKERIKTLHNIFTSPNSSVFANKGKNGFYFEFTDSSGTIIRVAPDGDVSKFQTGIYPVEHFYLQSDLDFDKSRDHLFFYERKFEAYNNLGARIANYPLNGRVNKMPGIIHFTDSSYFFYYTDSAAGKIFVHNNQGDALGNSPFDGNSGVAFEVFENSNPLLNLYYCKDNILFCVSVE